MRTMRIKTIFAFFWLTILVFLFKFSKSKVKATVEEEKIPITGELLSHEEWMNRRSLIYEERRTRVKRVCTKYQKRWVLEKPGDQFIVDVGNGLGYCRQAKVGSCKYLKQVDLNYRDAQG